VQLLCTLLGFLDQPGNFSRSSHQLHVPLAWYALGHLLEVLEPPRYQGFHLEVERDGFSRDLSPACHGQALKAQPLMQPG
jgi:hypothetical protein